MDFASFLAAARPELPAESADAVLALAAEGAQVPFIARYRRERTGDLDEAGVRAVLEVKEDYDAILARQQFVLQEIERQRRLTPELREQVLSTFDREVLDDLYLPY